MEKNMSVNSRPMLTLEKEIVSKADTRTIENINASRNREALMQDSSIPTTPTTISGLLTIGA